MNVRISLKIERVKKDEVREAIKLDALNKVKQQRVAPGNRNQARAATVEDTDVNNKKRKTTGDQLEQQAEKIYMLIQKQLKL